MDKTFNNYTPEQVNHFLDQIIIQVEKMIEDNKAKNMEIALRDAKIDELTKNEVHSKYTGRIVEVGEDAKEKLERLRDFYVLVKELDVKEKS